MVRVSALAGSGARHRLRLKSAFRRLCASGRGNHIAAHYGSVFDSMEHCVIHSNTFGQNDLAMAAALATLLVMEEDKLAETPRALERRLSRG